MRARETSAVRFACAAVGAVDRACGASRRYAVDCELREMFADEAREIYGGGEEGATTGVARFARLARLTGAAVGDLVADAALAPFRHGQAKRQPKRSRESNRGDGAMQTFWNDFKLALRGLRRQPGFSLAVVLTLALGIAANGAIFALVDALLLRPLPYPEPERLVRVVSVWSSQYDNAGGGVNPLDVLDWERESPAFEHLGAFSRGAQALTGAGDPTMISVGFATPSLFQALEARPAIGRLFGAEHEAPGHEDEVVLSDGLWRRRFGGDPSIVGRPISIAGASATVIGILPRQFASPGTSAESEPELWRPFLPDPEGGRGGHFMKAVGRLREGATLEQARAQLLEVSRRLEKENPSTNHELVGSPIPLAESISGSERPALLLLAGAVGVVLLIACANVAHLLLARAAGREREMAVRGALGARRGRLARQLLTESLLFSALAGALGVVGAWLVVRALPSSLVDTIPTVLRVQLDLRVVAFTFLLSAATTALFGLAPTLSASRVDLRGALVSGTRAAGGRGRAQLVLLVAETALALVLLISATLLLESFAKLQRVDPGFDSERVLTFRVGLPRTRYEASARRAAFFADLETRLAALPGVEAAGGVNMAPLTDRMSCDSFGLADRPAPPAGEEPCAESRAATADYFRAMSIDRVAGRGFEPTDTEESAPVVVVSETMAKKYWPKGDAVGQSFKWGSAGAEGPWRTIVGVVSDIKFFGLDAEPAPEVYSPVSQSTPYSMTLAVRTARDPALLANEARKALAAIDPELPLFELKTTKELLDRSTTSRRLQTNVLAAFAATALALAMVGIHGVMAFYVAGRSREIGIRMSLGASAHEVRWQVMRRGVGAAAVGAAIGLAGAFGAARLLEGLLFGVKATDATAFFLAPLLLLGTALIASYLPARRATKIDPLEAIRTE